MKGERKIIITLKDVYEGDGPFDDVMIDTEGEVDTYDLMEGISALIKTYSDHSDYAPACIAKMAVKAVMLAKGAEEKSDEEGR